MTLVTKPADVPLSPSDLRRARIHEAGHAVVSEEVGFLVRTVHFDPAAGHGEVRCDWFPDWVRTDASRARRARIDVGLAGSLAEALAYRGSQMRWSPKDVADVQMLMQREGLDPEEWLAHANERARDLLPTLDRRWSAVLAIAKALRKGNLSGDEVRSIIAGAEQSASGKRHGAR
jgi:hypothetical protein